MIDSLDVAVDDGGLEGVEVDEAPGGAHGDVAPLLPGERLRPLLALEPVRHAPVGHELVHQARVGLQRLGEAAKNVSTMCRCQLMGSDSINRARDRNFGCSF